VLDSDVESLADNSVSDLLVDDDADGAGVHVEDCSGSAVVVLVWQTFVDGSVADHIDNISIFVGGEIFGNVNGSVLSEPFSEFMSGSSFIPVAVSHGFKTNKII
jgi:hypothetical protein